MTDEEKKYLESGRALTGGHIPTLQAITDQEIAPITSEVLKPQTPINVPLPVDNTDWSALMKGIGAENTAMTPKEGTTPDWLSNFLSSAEKPSSLTSEYGAMYGTAGIDIKSQAVVESQKQLDILNAQMAGLTAEAQAVPIQLQQESIGRGVTAAGVKPIETAKLREIALKALPLQAQILAQQAIVTGNQGTLKLAQDKLNTLFTLKSKDIENAYNYRKDTREKIWDLLTAKEKAKIDAQQKADDRKYDQEKANLKSINDWSKLAIDNRQSNLIGEISRLDPKSSTFKQDLGAITSKITLKEEWSEPYMLGGDYVQKNTKTGQIRTAVSVPGRGEGADVSPEVIADYTRRLDAGEIQLNDIPSNIRNQVLEKSVEARQPRDFTDDEIRTLVNEDKTAGSSYEDIISAIDTFPTLKNKDRAREIADEIFEKKSETKTGLFGAVSSFFSRLFGK